MIVILFYILASKSVLQYGLVDAQKSQRRTERRVKELTFSQDEDQKKTILCRHHQYWFFYSDQYESTSSDLWEYNIMDKIFIFQIKWSSRIGSILCKGQLHISLPLSEKDNSNNSPDNSMLEHFSPIYCSYSSLS